MRPELLNRIDNTIVFHALTKQEILRILNLQLKNLEKRLVSHGVILRVSQTAKNYLCDHGYDAKNGVRPLRRLLQDTLEDEISNGLLDGRYTKGSIVSVTLKKGQLSYSVESE